MEQLTSAVTTIQIANDHRAAGEIIKKLLEGSVHAKINFCNTNFIYC